MPLPSSFSDPKSVMRTSQMYILLLNQSTLSSTTHRESNESHVSWGNSHPIIYKKRRKRPSERVTTIREHTNVDNQFQLTPAVIEVRRIEQKELPLDELAAIFRIQEGDPEKVVERVSSADKKLLIASLITW